MSNLGRNERLALICRYKGREESCSKECETCAIKIKENGDVALQEGDLHLAIRLYKQALFLEPAFTEAWNNLANAYNAISEPNNALECFNRALSTDPEYGKAMLGKAKNLRLLGLLDDAMALANDIVDLYDAEEAITFKKELVDAGVEDKHYLIENEIFIRELDNYGYDVASENDLLDGQEFYDAIAECGDVYQPDEFIDAVLKYCRKKYASLGEQKVLGECIITSFYGSICAAMFYSKDDSIYDDVLPFDYLKDHIDVEFTDRNAERLLQTKEGEEKAEYIWGIISPYIKFAQEIFKKTSKLTDDVILCAMKNAYEIGLLTAFYYINGTYKKHILGTKEQIEDALSKLAASSKNYQDPPPPSAMCYSRRVPQKITIQYICDKCKGTTTHEVNEGNENIIAQYREMAQKFLDLGHKARFSCHCDACAKKSEVTFLNSTRTYTKNFVFSFWAKNADSPIDSYPNDERFSDFKYRVALAFLQGATSVTELAAITGSKENAANYIQYVKDVVGEQEVSE